MRIFSAIKNLTFLILIILSLAGCGGGGGSASTISQTAIFVDDIVEGIYYEGRFGSGYTNSKGEFPYFEGKVEFFIGSIKIGEISQLPNDKYVFIQDTLGLSRTNTTDEKVLNIATFLQSLDSNSSTSKIEIRKEDFNKFTNINKSIHELDMNTMLSKKGFTKKSEDAVRQHLNNAFNKYGKNFFDQNEKDFLYNQLHTDYLWSENVPFKSYEKYTDPNAMINDFKYATLDRWSFAQKVDDYYNYVYQNQSGFGCYFFGTPRINSYEFGSPCEQAGLKRGDILWLIDGNRVTSELYLEASQNNGKTVTFTVERGNDFLDIEITPSVYTYTVSKSNMYSIASKKVGYFIYNAFTSTSSSEIEDAFSDFKQNNIDELIVDLRYNQGGSVTVASILLDKLAAANREDELQFYLIDRYGNKDNYFFEEDSNSLDLTRVIFLTSEYSASASELVINALKPYVDVKVIGERTHGKPVGMQGKSTSSNSKYIYWLINFAILNSNDEGHYYSGLNVNCSVSNKDPIYELGDINEPLLKEALYYIDNDTCNTSTSFAKVRINESKSFINNFKRRN